MTRIKHRFTDHKINPKTEILVIGTFNPETKANTADFFYGRQRNFLWVLIPAAFNEASLKGKPVDEKKEFIEKHKIGFVDLIVEVDVEAVANYDDSYIDGKVTEWRDVIAEISKLKNLKRVCFTRRSFGGIPNMKTKIEAVRHYCEKKKIPFQALTTPARFYSQAKQTEWTGFFKEGNSHLAELLSS
ncbi:MAG: hypothetical protein PHD73_10995 [Sediminibacterium sp.]|nr:hypothetical protein [Sediminibacterium sp.]